MTANMKLGVRLALASAILPALLAAPLSAQGTTTDPRWLPWLGCWQTVAPGDAGLAGVPAAAVCVVPTNSASAVEVLTLEGGAVGARDRIDASGGARPSSEEGCTGTERVQWSEDGRRLYRTTEQQCTGGIQRRVSGVLAILPSGEWLNAQGVAVGGNTQVRVLRYRPLTQLAGLPAEATRALQGRTLAVDAARTVASATPSTRDIAEAARHLDPDVAGAWLIERGQGFALDSKKLVELADAGVPDPVIDIMVALSYPQRFAIDQANGPSELRPEDDGRIDGRRTRPARSPWGYYPGYGYGYPYGSYGYGWGWGGYYNGYYNGYYGSPVVVIREPGRGEENPRGRARAVNGQGYTRTGSSGSSEPSSRPSTTRSSGNEGSRSSGGTTSSGGSSSSGDSGSSGSSTGRTAKPRGGG